VKPSEVPGVPEPGVQTAGAHAVQVAALRLLARREHSSEELKRKLLAKGHPGDAVAAVIAALNGRRLVSDERFVASYVHHHAARGQGPVKIRAELRQHGVSAAAIEAEMNRAEVDWMRLAAQVRARKFGSRRLATAAERAKQARFLQYRGFDAEQLRAAFRDESGEAGDAPDITPDIAFEAE
jgi:regulatory protein